VGGVGWGGGGGVWGWGSAPKTPGGKKIETEGGGVKKKRWGGFGVVFFCFWGCWEKVVFRSNRTGPPQPPPKKHQKNTYGGKRKCVGGGGGGVGFFFFCFFWGGCEPPGGGKEKKNRWCPREWSQFTPGGGKQKQKKKKRKRTFCRGPRELKKRKERICVGLGWGAG